jgi:hypothetical protein
MRSQLFQLNIVSKKFKNLKIPKDIVAFKDQLLLVIMKISETNI